MDERHSWDVGAAELYSETAHPIVVRGGAADWPLARFDVDEALARFAWLRVAFRLFPRTEAGGAPEIPLETRSVYVCASLAEFSAWRRGCASPDQAGDLAEYDPALCWAYADYKRAHELFRGREGELEAAAPVHSLPGDVTGHAVDASGLTVWFGTEGATTHTHYDTYGRNVAVQLCGRKRWRLWGPARRDALAPSRLPFEESTVFSQLGLEEAVAAAGQPWVADLGPGDVLLVPRHWWHHVECTEAAVSVNLWVDHPRDPAERVREALCRTLLAGLQPALGAQAGATSPVAAADSGAAAESGRGGEEDEVGSVEAEGEDGMTNVGETLGSVQDSVGLLVRAVAQRAGPRPAGEVPAAARRATALALMKAVTQPSVLESVAQAVEADLRPMEGPR